MKDFRDLDVAPRPECRKSCNRRIGAFTSIFRFTVEETELFDNTRIIFSESWTSCGGADALFTLEMETYTWEVMPAEMKNRSVVDQLVAEYDWTLKALEARGLGRK